MNRHDASLADMIAQLARMSPDDRRFVTDQLDPALQQRLLPHLEAHHGAGALSPGLTALLEDATALAALPARAANALRQASPPKPRASLPVTVVRPTGGVVSRLGSFVRAGGW